uniref:Glutamine amidotransferase type-2 domain-containing protein n=1 Tax=Ditylenchus dipsaci TaxID=166011 RepID=A0A915CNJ6_9BILA
MCGIFAICHPKGCPSSAHFDVQKAQQMSIRQKHRGPDYRGVYQHPKNGNILCHERLAIMDLGCIQPIQGTREDHQVIHNGEIYNFRSLEKGELSEYKFTTTCDSEGSYWNKANVLGVDKDGRHFFSSEMKCIEDTCGESFLQAFPPGHYWTPEEAWFNTTSPAGTTMN